MSICVVCLINFVYAIHAKTIWIILAHWHAVKNWNSSSIQQSKQWSLLLLQQKKQLRYNTDSNGNNSEHKLCSCNLNVSVLFFHILIFTTSNGRVMKVMRQLQLKCHQFRIQSFEILEKHLRLLEKKNSECEAENCIRFYWNDVTIWLHAPIWLYYLIAHLIVEKKKISVHCFATYNSTIYNYQYTSIISLNKIDDSKFSKPNSWFTQLLNEWMNS